MLLNLYSVLDSFTSNVGILVTGRNIPTTQEIIKERLFGIKNEAQKQYTDRLGITGNTNPSFFDREINSYKRK